MIILILKYTFKELEFESLLKQIILDFRTAWQI